MSHFEENETEWIEAINEEGKEISFEVPANWLWKTLKDWAEDDAEDVENDKETYIEGRTEHLYEHLQDENFANTIYDMACKAEVIIAIK